MSAYKILGWSIKDFLNANAYYENLITLPDYMKSDEVRVIMISFNKEKSKYVF